MCSIFISGTDTPFTCGYQVHKHDVSVCVSKGALGNSRGNRQVASVCVFARKCMLWANNSRLHAHIHSLFVVHLVATSKANIEIYLSISIIPYFVRFCWIMTSQTPASALITWIDQTATASTKLILETSIYYVLCQIATYICSFCYYNIFLTGLSSQKCRNKGKGRTNKRTMGFEQSQCVD